MPRFAENTSVPTDRSKAEIERLVAKYGASAFQSGWEEGRAAVAFVMRERRVRFVLPLPPRDADEFRLTPGGRRHRSPEQRLTAWEQACRQRWRALALAIKAKLEAVECGISEFDVEFLPFIIDPATNQTVADRLVPQIEASYESARLGQRMAPIALLGGPAT